MTEERHLNVGDLIMCRIPGLCKKLHDAGRDHLELKVCLAL